MTRRQWVILIVALVAVIALYNLPRSVVDNDSQTDLLIDQTAVVDAVH